MQAASYLKAFSLISQAKQGFSSGKAYTSCSELPLYNFIRVLCTGDLKFLVVKGQPQNLEDTWENIFSEYLTMSRDTSHSFFLTCLKEITVLSNKLTLIQTLVDRLALSYDKDLVTMLKALTGSRLPFNPDKYQKDLQLTVSSAKAMLLRIEQRKKDLESLKSKDEAKEEDYYSLISELSKFQGYRLNPRETSVTEFIAVLKRFKESIKNGKGRN